MLRRELEVEERPDCTDRGWWPDGSTGLLTIWSAGRPGPPRPGHRRRRPPAGRTPEDAGRSTGGRTAATDRPRPLGQRRDRPPLVQATHSRANGRARGGGLWGSAGSTAHRCRRSFGRCFRQGAVDLLDRQHGLGRQRQVPLTVHRDRSALTRLLVELDVSRPAPWANESASARRSTAWPWVDGTLLGQQQHACSSRNFGVFGVRPHRRPLRRRGGDLAAGFLAGALWPGRSWWFRSPSWPREPASSVTPSRRMRRLPRPPARPSCP